LYEDCENYEYWKIRTYKERKPETELIHQVSIRFNSDGFSCTENTYTHELDLIFEPTGQPVKVFLKEDTEHFQITFESMVFGRKKSEERANRDLFKKVWERLPWAKEGFVWQNDTWVPVRKTEMRRELWKKRTTSAS